MVLNLQQQTSLLKENLAKTQNRMKVFADHSRFDRQYQVGKELAWTSVVSKVDFQIFWPIQVLARIGKETYKLELPETSLIHLVFHVSQPKPSHKDYTLVFTELPKVATTSYHKKCWLVGLWRKGIQQYHMCWSDGGIFEQRQQLGKISMWSLIDFHVLSCLGISKYFSGCTCHAGGIHRGKWAMSWGWRTLVISVASCFR